MSVCPKGEIEKSFDFDAFEVGQGQNGGQSWLTCI